MNVLGHYAARPALRSLEGGVYHFTATPVRAARPASIAIAPVPGTLTYASLGTIWLLHGAPLDLVHGLSWDLRGHFVTLNAAVGVELWIRLYQHGTSPSVIVGFDHNPAPRRGFFDSEDFP